MYGQILTEVVVITLNKCFKCFWFLAGVLDNDRELKKCLVDSYSLTDEQFLNEASKEWVPQTHTNSTSSFLQGLYSFLKLFEMNNNLIDLYNSLDSTVYSTSP